MDQEDDIEEAEKEIITNKLLSWAGETVENKVILDFMRAYHGMKYSMSTLKRSLGENGLRCKPKDGSFSIDEKRFKDMITGQIRASIVELCGYRSVWSSPWIEHEVYSTRCMNSG